jgi:hypothetical protein
MFLPSFKPQANRTKLRRPLLLPRKSGEHL